MCSSFPARTPKLQLIAGQLLKGECWVPPKKDNPCPRAKEKPQQDGRRGEIMFRIKPYPPETLRGLKQTSCAPGPRDPTKTEQEEYLSVSCRDTGQQWPAQGLGLWVQQSWVWHKHSWRRSPLTPPESHQSLHRTGETDSWRAQTEPCAHQDPGERSSDPTRN